MMNFNEFKTVASVKSAAREMMSTKLLEFFQKEFGESNVSIVGSNEIAVCVGTRNDSFGNPQEICVSIKPTAKDYENRKATKKSFVAFDRLAAAKEYENSYTEKEEKKLEKKAKKEAEK